MSSQKYQLTKIQNSSQVADETIVVNFQNGYYYGLNEVGTFIWEQLKENPLSIAELKEKVLETFEIDETTCENDVQAILKDLIHEKLVETA
jgi:hypothetical protein